ncbi:MAG: hypothetical protein IKF72_14340 [Kiritimatiellae bacterium]|nr:hypothetical protein [Kiritimatiellia bacterium]
MRELLVAVAACLVGVTLSAAQCEGKTQKGERCKREADAGSSYCIGHADQAKAKSEPKAKSEQKAKDKQNAQGGQELKDDGTCWAMTKAGTRCKHKKDGESDYCKQHAPSVKPSKPVTQCRALTYGGTQCVRKPVDGSNYCAQHGGK